MPELRTAWYQVLETETDFETAREWYTKRSGMFLERYRNMVAMGSMAIDPWTLGFFMALLEVCRPSLICETGTGASSIFIEHWASYDYTQCIHTEQDKQWLKTLRPIAKAFGLELSVVLSYEDFWKQLHSPYVALVDSKDKPDDIAHFSQYPNGVVLIRGADSPDVQEAARFYMESGTLYGLQSLTRDDYGHYAWLWIGPEFQFPDIKRDLWWRIK